MKFYKLAGAIIFPLLFLVLADAGFIPQWLQQQIAGWIALGGPITLAFFLLLFIVIGAKLGHKIYLLRHRVR
jgi:uncharacterized membrane protein (DUF485 family)